MNDSDVSQLMKHMNISQSPKSPSPKASVTSIPVAESKGNEVKAQVSETSLAAPNVEASSSLPAVAV